MKNKQSVPCRSCGAPNLEIILDLGLQPLANNLLKPEDLHKPEPRFPLELCVCTECWLAQISEIVPPVDLFSDYLYFSSFSDALLTHAKNAVQKYVGNFALSKESFVVEIASNDGYLLKNFVALGIPCLGVEPAKNIATVAMEKGIPTINEFFNLPMARKIAAEKGKADLILGSNVFAHVPTVNDFVAGLKALLAEKGRIALEFPYLIDLVEHREFDTIYHEHVFYFSVTALQPLFARHGLEIFDVEHLAIHGGSLRLFVGHEASHPVSAAVTALLSEERSRGVAGLEYYETFAAGVMRLKEELVATLRELKAQGKRIVAYGASAKGSTLLNFFAVGPETLEFVVDRSTYKQGRLTPGTHIPILPAEALLEKKPDYALLLTWNFAEEILKQQAKYRAEGGKFIIPIPAVRVA